MAEGAAQVDPAPEGKIVEGIRVVALDVFEADEAGPHVLNALHTTTPNWLVEREVLLRPGDRYRQFLVDESARNLRELSFSVVLCVPVIGVDAEHTQLLVIVKDVWTLRPSFDFAAGAAGLESLRIEPSERSVLGSHQSVVTRFVLDPASYALGGAYIDPRLGGRRLHLVTEANLLMNRERGQPEGSYGQVSIARPQYSSLSEWSWHLNVAWRDQIVRRYVDATVAEFQPSTPGARAFPDQYRARRLTQTASVVRSFGSQSKVDIVMGGEVNRRAYTAVGLDRADPRDVQEFEQARVPRSDTRAAPFVEARAYTTRFATLYDADTLGLAEDYSLDHNEWLRAYPVLKALGSSRDFLGVYAGAAYTLPIADGLAYGALESTIETTGPSVPDGAYALDVGCATPRLGIGRLVLDGSATVRYRNFMNERRALGGDGRLRGYPSGAFFGADVVSFNVEYRTRSLRVSSAQVGGVVFHDVGDAFDDFDHVRLKSSVGFGVRMLFPQIDRKVLRADMGFPIVGRTLPGVGPVGFHIAFEQAFPAGGALGGMASTENRVLAARGAELGQ
jgi:hypothetical protein